MVPEEPPWLSNASVRVALTILACHQNCFGRPLLFGSDAWPARQAAQELFAAPTVVLAHDGAADPRLIYANRAALLLWRRTWVTMVGLPSRLTAEPVARQERSAALEQARLRNALQGYAGIRIDSGGRRFRIENARLWTLRDGLRDGLGSPCGQAAVFGRWWWL